ncbi:hypothetical protein DQ04_00211150 [Trypanosoma grayi]|uniref:hypothetical protein n=1 Tax=Trypanosoma grayi TaxID=71804 RepID=UPI0004F3F905|nr:hypothetical protein DQ04_00211150 [Trypanosoma grayi]KEG15032.1 hypothetical protein DQ04_00211150 [Trypanosoma grayi]
MGQSSSLCFWFFFVCDHVPVWVRTFLYWSVGLLQIECDDVSFVDFSSCCPSVSEAITPWRNKCEPVATTAFRQKASILTAANGFLREAPLGGCAVSSPTKRGGGSNITCCVDL